MLAPLNQNKYSTEELQQQFSKILVSMASHIKYEPIAMGEASFSNLKSILTKQEQIDFKDRKIIFKKSKNKFPVYENPANNFYRLGRYLVEISVLKEKIYLFLLDESNQTRKFDARGDPDQLDNDGNTILLLQLWRKQIQYLFMEYYHKQRSQLLQRLRTPDNGQATPGHQLLSKPQKIKLYQEAFRYLLQFVQIRYGKVVFDHPKI